MAYHLTSQTSGKKTANPFEHFKIEYDKLLIISLVFVVNVIQVSGSSFFGTANINQIHEDF
jgi:hypothetical protein